MKYRYTCSKCIFWAVSEDEATLHFNKEHLIGTTEAKKEGSKKFTCRYLLPSGSKCGEKFNFKPLMLNHYRDHQNDLPCGCITCHIKDDQQLEVHTCDYVCPDTKILCKHEAPCHESLKIH